MADIELVIKIPEGLKKDFELEQWTALSCMEMKNALENAISLPKGHGRLIDADDIDNHIIGHVDTRSCPTIIEADKDCRECKAEHDCYECKKYTESEES